MNTLTRYTRHEVYDSPAWRAIRRQVLARDNHQCQVKASAKCRGIATTVDHIIELDDGGAPFDPANLQAACVSCNAVKRNKAVARRAQARRARANPIQEW